MARHHYSCPLRWSDMDAFQHVNNVVFVRYLEEARVAFMFSPDPDGGGSTGLADGAVVARHTIDYLRPLRWRPEPVTIETWVTRLGAARVDVAYEIRDETEVFARATSVIVPYDLATERPRRLTADERAYLARFTDDADLVA